MLRLVTIVTNAGAFSQDAQQPELTEQEILYENLSQMAHAFAQERSLEAHRGIEE